MKIMLRNSFPSRFSNIKGRKIPDQEEDNVLLNAAFPADHTTEEILDGDFS